MSSDVVPTFLCKSTVLSNFNIVPEVSRLTLNLFQTKKMHIDKESDTNTVALLDSRLSRLDLIVLDLDIKDL